MKHFVTIVQNDSICACYAYDDRTSAMAKFHHEMEYACNAGVTTLCSVMSANGDVVACEKHTAPPAPAPEPDPEPEIDGGEA